MTWSSDTELNSFLQMVLDDLCDNPNPGDVRMLYVYMLGEWG